MGVFRSGVENGDDDGGRTGSDTPGGYGFRVCSYGTGNSIYVLTGVLDLPLSAQRGVIRLRASVGVLDVIRFGVSNGRHGFERINHIGHVSQRNGQNMNVAACEMLVTLNSDSGQYCVLLSRGYAALESHQHRAIMVGRRRTVGRPR